MRQRKIKKSILYFLALVLVGGTLGCTNLLWNKYKDSDITPVVKPEQEYIPVTNNVTLIKPFNDEKVQILNGYYDYKDNEDSQINAIIYYDNTYMQSTGIVYGSDNAFDVVAVLDGEVIKVEDSSLAGKTVEIKHSDDLISVYQFLSDVDISVNTIVKQGQVIGKSGISNLADNTKNQLYFELIAHGELVNAENYYGKNISEI